MSSDPTEGTATPTPESEPTHGAAPAYSDCPNRRHSNAKPPATAHRLAALSATPSTEASADRNVIITNTHYTALHTTNLSAPPPLSVVHRRIFKLAHLFWSSAAPASQSPPPPAMAPHPVPELTPQFCFSPSALQDFLRLSRSAVDDSINQNLNALLTPSRVAFDPSSTAQRTPRMTKGLAVKECDTFCKAQLFPAWESRSTVLQYCKDIAGRPDAQDPSLAARELETKEKQEREINERLDPYSARFTVTESRTEKLARIVHMEEEVEDIVRRRTWEVVQSRCGSGIPQWKAAVEQWQAAKK